MSWAEGSLLFGERDAHLHCAHAVRRKCRFVQHDMVEEGERDVYLHCAHAVRRKCRFAQHDMVEEGERDVYLHCTIPALPSRTGDTAGSQKILFSNLNPPHVFHKGGGCSQHVSVLKKCKVINALQAR